MRSDLSAAFDSAQFVLLAVINRQNRGIHLVLVSVGGEGCGRGLYFLPLVFFAPVLQTSLVSYDPLTTLPFSHGWPNFHVLQTTFLPVVHKMSLFSIAILRGKQLR